MAVYSMMTYTRDNSYDLLCLKSCCSSFGVETISYTDSVQNWTIFDQSRMNKKYHIMTPRPQGRPHKNSYCDLVLKKNV